MPNRNDQVDIDLCIGNFASNIDPNSFTMILLLLISVLLLIIVLLFLGVVTENNHFHWN